MLIAMRMSGGLLYRSRSVGTSGGASFPPPRPCARTPERDRPDRVTRLPAPEREQLRAETDRELLYVYSGRLGGEEVSSLVHPNEDEDRPDEQQKRDH